MERIDESRNGNGLNFRIHVVYYNDAPYILEALALEIDDAVGKYVAFHKINIF